MKKIAMLLVLAFFGLSLASAQSEKEKEAIRYQKNVATFQSQNFTTTLTTWVNYPTNIGGNEQILRDVKVEFTPAGVTVNLPVLNKSLDNMYSVDRGGAFRVFDFKDAPYEIKNVGYTKNKKLYRALVVVKDPSETGMTLEFNILSNGTVQLIANCIHYERTVFTGFIMPREN